MARSKTRGCPAFLLITCLLIHVMAGALAVSLRNLRTLQAPQLVLRHASAATWSGSTTKVYEELLTTFLENYANLGGVNQTGRAASHAIAGPSGSTLITTFQLPGMREAANVIAALSKNSKALELAFNNAGLWSTTHLHVSISGQAQGPSISLSCDSHMDQSEQVSTVPAYPGGRATHLPRLVCNVEHSNKAGPRRQLMQSSPNTPAANGLPCPQQPTFPVAGQCQYSTGMEVYCTSNQAYYRVNNGKAMAFTPAAYVRAGSPLPQYSTDQCCESMLNGCPVTSVIGRESLTFTTSNYCSPSPENMGTITCPTGYVITSIESAEFGVAPNQAIYPNYPSMNPQRTPEPPLGGCTSTWDQCSTNLYNTDGSCKGTVMQGVQVPYYNLTDSEGSQINNTLYLVQKACLSKNSCTPSLYGMRPQSSSFNTTNTYSSVKYVCAQLEQVPEPSSIGLALSVSYDCQAKDTNPLVHLTCPQNYVISSVKRATWGRNMNDPANSWMCAWNGPVQAASRHSCTMLTDMAAFVESQCKGLQDCRPDFVNGTNEYYDGTDPCFGAVKWMEADWMCQPKSLVPSDTSLLYAPGSVYQQAIMSGQEARYCIADYASGTAPGSKVVLHHCPDTPTLNQIFSYTQDRRLLSIRGLYISAGSGASKAQLTLESGNAADPAQKWTWNNRGELIPDIAPTMCMNIQGAVYSSNTALQLYPCSKGLTADSNSQWTSTPLTAVRSTTWGGQLPSPASISAITSDSFLASPSGTYKLHVRADGALYVSNLNGLRVWDSGASINSYGLTSKGPIGGYTLAMQSNGDLQLLQAGTTNVHWNSNTGGKGYAPYLLSLDDSGTLYINDTFATTIWKASPSNVEVNGSPITGWDQCPFPAGLVISCANSTAYLSVPSADGKSIEMRPFSSDGRGYASAGNPSVAAILPAHFCLATSIGGSCPISSLPNIPGLPDNTATNMLLLTAYRQGSTGECVTVSSQGGGSMLWSSPTSTDGGDQYQCTGEGALFNAFYQDDSHDGTTRFRLRPVTGGYCGLKVGPSLDGDGTLQLQPVVGTCHPDSADEQLYLQLALSQMDSATDMSNNWYTVRSAGYPGMCLTQGPPSSVPSFVACDPEDKGNQWFQFANSLGSYQKYDEVTPFNDPALITKLAAAFDKASKGSYLAFSSEPITFDTTYPNSKGGTSSTKASASFQMTVLGHGTSTAIPLETMKRYFLGVLSDVYNTASPGYIPSSVLLDISSQATTGVEITLVFSITYPNASPSGLSCTGPTGPGKVSKGFSIFKKCLRIVSAVAGAALIVATDGAAAPEVIEGLDALNTGIADVSSAFKMGSSVCQAVTG